MSSQPHSLQLSTLTSNMDDEECASYASHQDNGLPVPNRIAYVPGTDFNKYMKQLREANLQMVDIYKQYKMYAYTRMTGGVVYDFIPEGMDIFHSMYVTRYKNYSLAGLSERMAQYTFQQRLVYMCPLFFDMDIETSQIVSCDMIEELMNKVLFPCAHTFFDLDKKSSALHLAMYSPMEEHAEKPTLQASIKNTLLCGCCKTQCLRMKMEGNMPVAECSTCGLRFPRSIQDNEVGTEILMVSKLILLKKYNACHSRNKLRFIQVPEAWTNITDPQITWDKTNHKVKFFVDVQPIEVTIGNVGNHVLKSKRKYSIHIKALQTTHAQIGQMKQHNDLAEKRFQAFQRKFHNNQSFNNDVEGFVKYECRKRSHQNKVTHNFEGPRVIRAYAEKQMPSYFGFPIFKMPTQDIALCEHLIDSNTISNVIMTQEIFLHFMSFLITKTTTYQSNLPDMHPLKHVDVLELFDPQPVTNGAALRVCFDSMNEPKPIKCKCENIPRTSRKRNNKGYIIASEHCERCHGKGFYMDTSRNPTRLVRVLVDPQSESFDVLQKKMDNFLPRLHEPKNLPILLAITSTRVSLSGLLHGESVLHKVTNSIVTCMKNVPPHMALRKNKSKVTGPELVDDHVLEVLKKYILATNIPQWQDLCIKSLTPYGSQRIRKFCVNIHPRSSGAHFCCYKNDEHRSNTIKFQLVPPTARTGACLVADCWSKTCCKQNKKKWHITPQDAAIIWPSLAHMTMLNEPNLTDATGSIRSVYNEDSSSNDVPSRTLSFRETLQSKQEYRSIVSAFEFFRLSNDESDPQPILLEAYRSLNLLGI